MTGRTPSGNLPSLDRDLFVVLPGILGSSLAKDGDLIWTLSRRRVIKAITTCGKQIERLSVPPGIEDNHPADGVEAVSLMSDFHVLPGVWTYHFGYDAILDWLRNRTGLRDITTSGGDRPANLLPVPYDWRLSNRYNGRRLKRIVEPALQRWRAQGGPFTEGKLVFICHSMGGLVARWFIEKEGGSEITRRLITLGTPHRGALKALTALINGVRRTFGPIGVNLTTFARSLPSLYELLPEYACLESPSGQLKKIIETDVPVLNRAMVKEALIFHEELDSSKASYELRPFVGVRQPTATTAQVQGIRIEPLETIDGENEGGDGTVPRVGATPKRLAPDDASVRWIPDQHGSLLSNQAMLDELEGILTARPVIRRAPFKIELGVRVPELVSIGEAIPVETMISPAIGSASSDPGRGVGLQVRVFEETGRELPSRPLDRAGAGTVGPLVPGVYRLVVGGAGSAAARVFPVTCGVLVWDPGEAE